MIKEIFVVLIFAFWLILHVCYIFGKKHMGSFGKWLHRWGFINEWSMYIGWKPVGEVYRVLYVDFDHDNEDLKWKQVAYNQMNFPRAILNPNMRLSHFLVYCKEKVISIGKSKEKQLQNKAVFDYLCAVINQLPNSDGKKFRKVKIEKQTNGMQRSTFLSSKNYKLK